jgi:ribonuclease BN (tRNA processing enzyme)
MNARRGLGYGAKFMRLLLLGTAGYHPNEKRDTACLMFPELGLIFDAGTSMFRVRDHLQTATLDIFLTHAHLDHIVGLTFLLDVLYENPMEAVRVHGEPHKLEAIQTHLFSEHLFPVPPPYIAVPLESEVRLSDGGVIQHFPLEHPGGSVGYRIDWPDRSMAYVTDTTAAPDAPYVDIIRGVDLLVHECNFPDGMESLALITGHSCTTPVAQVAAAAGVGRLVLVHVNPLSKEDDPVGLSIARRVFPATELGFDQMEIEF